MISLHPLITHPLFVNQEYICGDLDYPIGSLFIYGDPSVDSDQVISTEKISHGRLCANKLGNFLRKTFWDISIG